ncbi:hypothetical protein [Marinactinospora rubrisoli]|uniref:PhzF family phenazine biosynthesis protein n=1 Tax=Marinactinospora rubrisoli TaxID=2715399 RepID=A0ABW2KN60_9ACTN
MPSRTLHVATVFLGTDAAGRDTGGNPLGVFLDGAGIPAPTRQAVAADLGFAETVFVTDPAAGRIRARVFVVEHGSVVEDEATGSASLRLGALLGRPVTIRQGTGSRIDVRPRPDGLAEIGGRCALLGTREYRIG